jgi:hypothetical protein
MNEAKIRSTPMHPSTSLDKDESGKNVSEKEFRGMIESLLYLTASRPDIVFSVGLCARFQSSPKESHLIAVKRIFRYLVGTQNVGLWYKKGTHFDLQAYCDADYAGDKIERKAQVEHVNSLVKLLLVGVVENKIPLHFQLLKQNMSLHQIVVLK